LGVYYSTNNGTSWAYGSGSTWDLAGTTVQSFGAGSSTVYGGTSGRGVIVSHNNGKNWAQFNSGLTANDIFAFARLDTFTFAGTDKGPFVIGDAWEDWTSSNSGFGGNTALDLVTLGTRLLAGTSQAGVLLSTDRGVTWGAENTGLTAPRVQSIAFDSAYIYACTRAGLYRRPLSELAGPLAVRDQLLHPWQFQLEQNYPNPFNPTTTVRYSVGGVVPSHIKLAVYDILGHEVAVLVNERKEAGSYEVTWDAMHFPSGVYVYRLAAGGYAESKKILLLR
jgi:hypothetical protein